MYNYKNTGLFKSYYEVVVNKLCYLTMWVFNLPLHYVYYVMKPYMDESDAEKQLKNDGRTDRK